MSGHGEPACQNASSWAKFLLNTLLEEDDVEQAVVREVRELRTRGLSQRDVVVKLGRRGRLSRVGRRFQRTQVARMFGRSG